MLFVLSNDKRQGKCCLLCQMMKARVSVVCFVGS